MPTLHRWQSVWTGLDLVPPSGLFEEICRRYGEPHRAYHTLQHLDECLAHFDPARHLAEHPSEVELALWFHDAIYDTRAADSEAQSASWAERCLADAGATKPQCDRVSQLVLATQHASADASASPDRAVLLDTDLSILGAPRTRFLEYESQIRREYDWVPEPEFRQARAAILARFLARPRIYATDYFADRLESQARANLQHSIRALKASR